MRYELRHYTTPDTSTLGALTHLLGAQVIPEVQRLGIRVVGCWTVAIGHQPRLTMMLAFDDLHQREEQFAALYASDNWPRIMELASPKGNPLITGIESAILCPTPYSPDPFQFMNAASPGVFEERIYRGKDLRAFGTVNTRFNDHTVRIFANHGITPVGFWTVEIGADQPSLYYLVRFDDLAEYTPKWNAFRGDPEWQRVRAESEQEGNIILRISSAILTPTPFSPMQ